MEPHAYDANGIENTRTTIFGVHFEYTVLSTVTFTKGLLDFYHDIS